MTKPTKSTLSPSSASFQPVVLRQPPPQPEAPIQIHPGNFYLHLTFSIEIPVFYGHVQGFFEPIHPWALHHPPLQQTAPFQLGAPLQPHPDDFCLYLTFSNNHRVPYEYVRGFFERRHPRQVQSVYVHPGNLDPVDGILKNLWGKVVFTDATIPPRYISNPLLSFYPVPDNPRFPDDTRFPMYCKRFVSMPQNNNNLGGAQQ